MYTVCEVVLLVFNLQQEEELQSSVEVMWGKVAAVQEELKSEL